uniref:Uncharacterized protein n=1 Tax=Cyprinus carpio TaxID=7962 RepID=A0A8C1RDU5_CYPCA
MKKKRKRSRLGRPSVNSKVRDRHTECARNRRDSSSSTQFEYSQKSDRYSKEFSSQGRKCSESEQGGNEKMDRGERNSRDQDDGRKSSGGSLKKDIASNLLDIFSQIAEFKKENKLEK